ncbi:hypothetical protein AXF42_Ash010806 [Apostasia shenzhenica]|uniref:Uncharacterized protein n=1 Tax=Apostasia shenzhenica TaxID=1088818 RepID=A0A2I0A0Q4_9ASPA|nr:hypothetical protein AXF42_Ash010806 [Apostasia shenzhenica]
MGVLATDGSDADATLVALRQRRLPDAVSQLLPTAGRCIHDSRQTRRRDCRGVADETGDSRGSRQRYSCGSCRRDQRPRPESPDAVLLCSFVSGLRSPETNPESDESCSAGPPLRLTS